MSLTVTNGVTGEGALECGVQLVAVHRRQEADPPEVDPEDRDPAPKGRAQRAQHGAVAAEHDEEVEVAVLEGSDLDACGARGLLDPLDSGVDGVGAALRGDDPDPADALVQAAASASARETKNSRLPFGPRTGDSATPRTRAPHSGARATTASTTRRCTSGSRTTPPLPTSAGPASN